jgi:hypothetical protein
MSTVVDSAVGTGVGVVGFLSILVAFGLNSAGRLASGSYLYGLLNVFGSATLSWYAIINRVPIFLALEVVWGLIALGGIAKTLYTARTSRAPRGPSR